MSKSTPINQLPMTNNAEPSNNSNESELVQEILREIEDTQNVELNNPIVENTEPSVNLNMSIDTPPQNPVENQMQMPMPQMNQVPMNQMPMMNQMPNMNQMSNMNQMANMNQMPMMNMDINDMNQLQNASSEPEYKSTLEKITESLKLPAIVSMIVVLLSIPQVKNLIKKLVPEKFVSMGLGLTLVILLRGIIGGVLFYGANLVV